MQHDVVTVQESGSEAPKYALSARAVQLRHKHFAYVQHCQRCFDKDDRAFVIIQMVSHVPSLLNLCAF